MLFPHSNLFVLGLFALFAPSCKGGPVDDYAALRRRMVDQQLLARDIRDPRVLEAMGKVPRHAYVPAEFQARAYGDHPLPIGHGQTISQPYIVAYMTQAADLKPSDKVLEIGTGSGYQAAILAELSRQVYSIEVIRALADESRERLKMLGHPNVQVRHGDGYQGWPEEAPFDVIIVTAAPEHIPERLVEQLNTGGRMVIPVGAFYQELLLITKTEGGTAQRRLIPVRFVPMVRPNPE